MAHSTTSSALVSIFEMKLPNNEITVGKWLGRIFFQGHFHRLHVLVKFTYKRHLIMINNDLIFILRKYL